VRFFEQAAHATSSLQELASFDAAGARRSTEREAMHVRQHKPDKAATRAASFHSRYSYVSSRIHPGSDPPHSCVYLAGLEDIGKRRLEVFERDGFRCVDCGRKVNLEAPSYDPDSAHLAHGGHTKISRCWCMENLSLKCGACHDKNDHHGRMAIA
jgi:hypothetical protein